MADNNIEQEQLLKALGSDEAWALENAELIKRLRHEPNRHSELVKQREFEERYSLTEPKKVSDQ
jgi:hypothetical protein